MGPAGSGGRAGIGMKKLRTVVQIAFTIFTNGYAYGFLNGKIYQGSLKYACVPGLNCYSCPGAVAACPLGALQALLNRRPAVSPVPVQCPALRCPSRLHPASSPPLHIPSAPIAPPEARL